MAHKKNHADFSFATQCNVHELVHEWSLQDFKPELFENGEIIVSPSFPDTSLQNSAFWSIRAYFEKGQFANEKSINHKISISIVSHLEKEVLAKYKSKLIVECNISQLNLGEYTIDFDRIEPLEINFDGTVNEIKVKTIKYGLDTGFKNDLLFKFHLSMNSYAEMNSGTDCVKKIHKKFIWKIDSDLLSINNGLDANYAETPRFDFHENSNQDDSVFDELFENHDLKLLHKWAIHLYPRGRDPRYQNHISIFLKHLSGPRVYAVCEFCLSGNYNVKEITIPQQLYKPNRRWGFGDYINLDNFQQTFGDSVKIICKIKLMLFKTKQFELSNLIDYTNQNSLRFLTKLFIDYKNQNHCDINIRCELDGYIFHLHKLVLFNASEQFSIELDKQLQIKNEVNDSADENDEESVPVITMKNTRMCLQKFINFLYKHELERDYNLYELIELLDLAESYGVKTLANECHEFIIKNFFDNKSLFILLSIKDQPFIQEIKKTLCMYIKRYFNQISELTSWKEFTATNTSLYKDLILNIMS